MRKSRLGVLTVKAEEKEAVTKKKEVNYTEVVEPRELEIAEGIKLVFSVSTTTEGYPHMDIRTHIQSEKYTGPTKKGINFCIENLEEFRELLKDIDNELQEKGF